MSNTKKNDEGLEVAAWVAHPSQAKKISDEDLEKLEAALNSSLAVERKDNGSLVLYTSDPDVERRLEELMTILNVFQRQKIYVDPEEDN